jgi:hypothetical protein
LGERSLTVIAYEPGLSDVTFLPPGVLSEIVKPGPTVATSFGVAACEPTGPITAIAASATPTSNVLAPLFLRFLLSILDPFRSGFGLRRQR